MSKRIGLLRLDHRVFRDQRITSHVALTARALGGNIFAYSGEKDINLEESISDVSTRWGGQYEIEYVTSIRSFINKWNGVKVHLTMYGENHLETISELKQISEESVLVIVGGSKVPRYIYNMVDFNTSIGKQPHSEVAATAIFLYELLGKDTLYKSFTNSKISIKKDNKKSKRSLRFKKVNQ